MAHLPFVSPRGIVGMKAPHFQGRTKLSRRLQPPRCRISHMQKRQEIICKNQKIIELYSGKNIPCADLKRGISTEPETE